VDDAEAEALMHARQAIRYAIAELLRSTATAGNHVFPSRLFSLDESELPSISVFTTDDSNVETVTKLTLSRPPLVQRELPVVIEAHAVMDETIDDVLDNLAVEIETAMAQAIMIGGTQISARLVSTQTTFSGESELQVGVIRLIYAATYATRENTPDQLA
jgi:hypothetical protein